MSFSTLALMPQILQNLKTKGYEKPTPIQSQVIPLALNGRDILAAAQTGTGKTAAFALPILQALSKVEVADEFHSPKALILVPTRELAMQVGKNIEAYGEDLPLKSAAIYGGANIAPQTKKLAGGIDIIIATPGRLLDHIKLKGVSLSKIEFLILDEADSMLDMGFIREIEKILALIPAKRQTMLFSATLSGGVKRLSETILKKPQLVQVASYASVAEKIKQMAYSVDKEQKSELLSYMIGSNNWKQVLIFCRTKASVGSSSRVSRVSTPMRTRWKSWVPMLSIILCTPLWPAEEDESVVRISPNGKSVSSWMTNKSLPKSIL
jgi:ATP-dependent RNA helicase RhlE